MSLILLITNLFVKSVFTLTIIPPVSSVVPLIATRTLLVVIFPFRLDKEKPTERYD